MKEIEIGIVDHFFSHLSVVGIQVTEGTIKIGDTLHFIGHTTNFEEKVTAMQKEHLSVKEARSGDAIGMPVQQKARKHDKVFKVVS